MIRDFSETTKLELTELIVQAGAGKIIPEGKLPVVMHFDEAGTGGCIACVWAEKLGVNASIRKLSEYEALALEKSSRAQQTMRQIFEDVICAESEYAKKTGEEILKLQNMDICLKQMHEIISGAGICDNGDINFRLSEISETLTALQEGKIPEKTDSSAAEDHDPDITETGFSYGITGKTDFGAYKLAPSLYINGETGISAVQSIWEDEACFYSGMVDARMGTAYAQFQADAGIFTYNDDGLFFSPCVHAGVSTGTSALGIYAEGKIGNDDLGIYANGQVDVLEAQAEAEFGVGMFYKKGQGTPEFYARASAQANAAEVSGSIGLSVLGAQVGIKGGINAGVGAHAEIGYTDGRFTMDVGASFGVGVSFGLDLDVDALMAGVYSAAGEAVSWMYESLENSWTGFVEFWNFIFNQ